MTPIHHVEVGSLSYDHRFHGPPGSASTFDLLVAGGWVIDPATGRSGRYDIGVINDHIDTVQPDLPLSMSAQVVDARGCIVLPGLVDLHTHIFSPGTYWGIDPRPVAWRTGVTAWVDAGSGGAYNIGALDQLANDTGLSAKAFVNISAVGLVAETGEARRDDLCDVGLCASVFEQHPRLAVGVKCRLDRFAVGELGLLPLQRAISAATQVGVPVMVHIGAGPPEIDPVLDMLRPGDILTHCMTGQGMSVVGPTGMVRPSASRARERGVLFDVGHGSGAFSFTVAEALLAAGYPPHVISSDLHQHSLMGPAFDLPTCMSKFLTLGMSLEEVVRATTVSPARAVSMEHEWGSLETGRRADIAVFEYQTGDFVLYDTYLESRRATRLLVNRATIASGVKLPAMPPLAPAPWVPLTERQSALLQKDVDLLRGPWTTLLEKPQDFVKLELEGPPGRHFAPWTTKRS